MLSGRLKYVCYAARCIVGLLFIVSAVLKFQSIDSFELYLLSLDWFSFFWSSIFARLLILAEGILGVSLIVGIMRSVVDFAAYFVLGVFSLFLLYLISQGYDGNCHCMGEQIDLPPVQSLLKNAMMAVLVFVSSLGWVPSFKQSLLIKIVASLGLVAGVAIFVASPPDAFLVKRKTPVIHQPQLDYFLANDSIFQTKFANKPKCVVCMYSTGCHICKLSSKKFQLLADHVNLPSDLIYILFSVDINEPQNEAFVNKFFAENSVKPATYQMLDTEKFSLLVGSIPIYLVCEYGKVKEVYNYRLLTEDVVKGILP